MLKRDPRAHFVSEGVFFKKYHLWSPAGGSGKYLTAVAYKQLLVHQEVGPMLVMQSDALRRQWWMFRGEFFWDDEGLNGWEVDALLKERAIKRQRRLDRAVATVQQQKRSEASTQRHPISDDVRMFVWQRDKGRCVKCGSQKNLEFDHIIPVSMGGSNTARNIQLLCETCNRSKGASIS